MKSTSVRDLRYRFPQVERALSDGIEVQITKRGRVIGRLVPEPRPLKPPKKFPDFMARLKKTYGNKILKVSGAELLRRDRDRS